MKQHTLEISQGQLFAEALREHCISNQVAFEYNAVPDEKAGTIQFAFADSIDLDAVLVLFNRAVEIAKPRYQVQHVLPLIKEALGVDIQTLQITGSAAVKAMIGALRDQLNSYSGSGFNPDDPEFAVGLDALVTVGVFTSEQRAQIVPLIKKHLTPIR